VLYDGERLGDGWPVLVAAVEDTDSAGLARTLFASLATYFDARPRWAVSVESCSKNVWKWTTRRGGVTAGARSPDISGRPGWSNSR
jgi:hypothetical protein